MHALVSGRHPCSLGGACEVFQEQTTTFHDSVGSVLISSSMWLDMCTRRCDDWVSVDFFLFTSLFYFSSPRVSCLPLKKLNVLCQFVFISILVLILLVFNYLAFNAFWSWFCFSILSLNIWFYLIFVSNLILIFFIAIFLSSSWFILFFNFMPHYFISFNFYTRFNPHFFIVICLFFNLFLDCFFFQFHPSIFKWLEILLCNFFIFFIYEVVSVSWPESQVTY
jgi:hypothetical protein